MNEYDYWVTTEHLCDGSFLVEAKIYKKGTQELIAVIESSDENSFTALTTLINRIRYWARNN